MTAHYIIRPATATDEDTIVTFTRAEAREAEGLELEVATVTRGVRHGLAEPALATYWLVEDPGGRVVASTSITAEWSDFHGAPYWWIQSLFIVPDHRGRGLVELVLDHLAREAEAAGALDLRLYAHSANQRALRAYGRCGFEAAPYTIMRRSLKPG